jgi:hypothetical protein
VLGVEAQCEVGVHQQAEELDDDGGGGGGGLDDERDAAGPQGGARDGEGLAEQVVESELPGETRVWGKQAGSVAAEGAGRERFEPLGREDRGGCERRVVGVGSLCRQPEALCEGDGATEAGLCR